MFRLIVADRYRSRLLPVSTALRIANEESRDLGVSRVSDAGEGRKKYRAIISGPGPSGHDFIPFAVLEAVWSVRSRLATLREGDSGSND